MHKAHKLGAINNGGPKWGANRYRTNCHINTMLVASPASMQMIQAGQNEPSRLSIGSQAVKKTVTSAKKTVLPNQAMDIMFFA